MLSLFPGFTQCMMVGGYRIPTYAAQNYGRAKASITPWQQPKIPHTVICCKSEKGDNHGLVAVYSSFVSGRLHCCLHGVDVTDGVTIRYKIRSPNANIRPWTMSCNVSVPVRYDITAQWNADINCNTAEVLLFTSKINQISDCNSAIFSGSLTVLLLCCVTCV